MAAIDFDDRRLATFAAVSNAAAESLSAPRDQFSRLIGIAADASANKRLSIAKLILASRFLSLHQFKYVIPERCAEESKAAAAATAIFAMASLLVCRDVVAAIAGLRGCGT